MNQLKRFFVLVFKQLTAHYCHIYLWPPAIFLIAIILNLTYREDSATIFPECLALASGAALARVFSVIGFGKASLRWPTVVTEVVVEGQSGSGSDSGPQFSCSYEFSYDDRDFAGRLISFSSTQRYEWLRKHKFRASDLEKSGPVGLNIEVSYCPSAPALSCVLPGYRKTDIIMPGILATILAVAAGWYWIYDV